MKARVRRGVRLRSDKFGGICYVPHRDDFFVTTPEVFAVLARLGESFCEVSATEQNAVRGLSRLGICETEGPRVAEEAYSGPHFIGRFIEIPSVTEPLVLNCFCTAHCPLKCQYCHADDLMQEYRGDEVDRDIESVAATARMVPAIVAVVTGGDPLTRPSRAIELIEKLSTHKAVVLDTSGVGDVELLLPALIKHHVHVRVSLDSVTDLNDKIRPGNRAYGYGKSASREGAINTIRRCVASEIPVTVQTVVSALNEYEDEWRILRDWLLREGVRHWVLHVCIKGGSARRIQADALSGKRRQGIVPGPHAHQKLSRFIRETSESRYPLDIRCTDTDTTPNSVLLVGSKGDLYTEGYAHNGKVSLYKAGQGRPDLVRALWPHVDRFGHAKRYLNWNPWFFDGVSLEELCVPIKIQKAENSQKSSLVETEAKYCVNDLQMLKAMLRATGFVEEGEQFQRDEYFDNSERRVASLDYVVRLRRENEDTKIAFKGPRDYSHVGESSRIEIEVSAGGLDSVYADLKSRGLEITWFFEKRRTEYRSAASDLKVSLDEVPEVGYFLEIEGPQLDGRMLREKLGASLGNVETRNYRDIYLDFKSSQGVERSKVLGARFSEKSADQKS